MGERRGRRGGRRMRRKKSELQGREGRRQGEGTGIGDREEAAGKGKEEEGKGGKEGRRKQIQLRFLLLIPLTSVLSSKYPQFLDTGAQSRVIKIVSHHSGGNSQMHSPKLPDNWIIKSN